MGSIQNMVSYMNKNHEDPYLVTYDAEWLDHPKKFHTNHSQYFEEPPNPQKSNLEMLMKSFIETQTHYNMESMMQSFVATKTLLNKEFRN